MLPGFLVLVHMVTHVVVAVPVAVDMDVHQRLAVCTPHALSL